MSGWSFALSKRWFGYLALTIVFAIVCCLLGVWQLNRRAEARVEIDRVDANYASDPVALHDVLAGIDDYTESQKWTPVTMRGSYLRDEQILVRARPYNGNPGFEVLTPLLLDDGTVFIVDRGWVSPGSKQDTPDKVPDAPDGPVTVTARLKAGEPTIPGRSAPAGQIATIHLPDVAKRIGLPTFTAAYGLMMSEDPSPADRPLEAKKPPRDEGPHLSYAFQWFVFALFGFLGLGYGLRQEYRLVNIDDPDEQVRAEKRRVKQAAKAKTDAQIEDELVDANH
ncbi:MAG: SURF1 family protein [Microbacteriaceae bacterium]